MSHKQKYHVESLYKTRSGNPAVVNGVVEAYSEKEAQKIMDERAKNKTNFESLQGGSVSQMAQGGNIGDHLTYDQIYPVIKDQVKDAFKNVVQKYELYGENISEVPHKSVSGFIPFTDGGAEASAYQDIGYFESTGYRMPTKKSQELLSNDLETAHDMALEEFSEKYPELFKRFGKENISYGELYDAGFIDEAEKFDMIYDDYKSGDQSSVLFQLNALYYKPDNYSNNIPGNHTITLQSVINFEAPYHRRGAKWEDYTEKSFSFRSIDELKMKLRQHLEKALDWFGADKKFAKGGIVPYLSQKLSFKELFR